jgi:hypothetical protein
MELTELIEELKTTLEQYRLSLKPGVYLFAPELHCGKMTGKILENRSETSAYIQRDEPCVTFGFCPLGFVPASLKGAPPSWLSGYPLLRGMEKLAEAPKIFLELLKLYLEERMQPMKGATPSRRAEPHALVQETAGEVSLQP